MMNYKAIIFGLLILYSYYGYSNKLNDTINIVINLKQIDSAGLKIKVHTPNNLKVNTKYQFPRSIPGIYELLNHSSLINPNQNEKFIENSFNINTKLSSNTFIYSAKSSVSKFKGISAEDTYFIKDSIYILNWHYLIGYFDNNTELPYKIKIIKNKKLFASGTLHKTILNDSIDIFTANNYKELIHNPIIYSVPDTTNFNIGNTKFTISYAGSDSNLNSKKIKNLLINPLRKILSKSYYKPNKFTFLYYSEYSLAIPYITGLEHPNSTLICYHSAFHNNDELVNSSIHEFIHALFAPLNIRSNIIDNFNFSNPKCDEFLWFYEGVTEYLSQKTLLQSKIITSNKFLDELNESNNEYKNINFGKISKKIYTKKGEKLFDNFYTKGSLFAFELDIKIIKLSNGKTDLFGIMQKLQKKYNSKSSFSTSNFLDEFEKLSGVDIKKFITNNTYKKTKIKFVENVNQIGYYPKIQDSIIWNFSPKKVFIILNYKKNRLEYSFLKSTINRQLNKKIVTIYEINDKPITWFNNYKILAPTNGDSIKIKAYWKNRKYDLYIKPKQKIIKKIKWIRNENANSLLANKFWNS